MHPKVDNFRKNNFDIIRLFAATQVLIIHSVNHLKILSCPRLIDFIALFPGVPMFFVMSGYLISASYENSNGLSYYYRNRILRIYPALWFCIALTTLVIYVVSKISFLNLAGIKWFFSQLAGVIYTPYFLKNYRIGSYNGSLWTIPVELQFYILLPFIYFLNRFLIKRENNRKILLFGLLLFFTTGAYIILEYYPIREIETLSQKILSRSFVPHLYLFLLGVLLQQFEVYKSRLFVNKGLIWLLLYLIFSLTIPYTAITSILGNILLGLCTISVSYSLVGLSKLILNENDLSYGVYIYHGLILGVFVELKIIENTFILFLIIILTYLIAFLSWKFVEKPFLTKKRDSIRPFI